MGYEREVVIEVLYLHLYYLSHSVLYNDHDRYSYIVYETSITMYLPTEYTQRGICCNEAVGRTVDRRGHFRTV